LEKINYRVSLKLLKLSKNVPVLLIGTRKECFILIKDRSILRRIKLITRIVNDYLQNNSPSKKYISFASPIGPISAYFT